uniref:Uncharacterized protein n=1 Tax=Triticum urartu TaxID=4572 RepID=A0A8R7P319_TRIUA
MLYKADYHIPLLLGYVPLCLIYIVTLCSFMVLNISLITPVNNPWTDLFKSPSF